MAHFIPVGEVLTRIRMLTRENILEWGKDAWGNLAEELEQMSKLCRGEQEQQRWKWGRDEAFQACLETVPNVHTFVRYAVREEKALRKADAITEEEYQFYEILIPQVQRVAWQLEMKQSFARDKIYEWAELCASERRYIPFYEWHKDEVALDQFFSYEPSSNIVFNDGTGDYSDQSDDDDENPFIVRSKFIEQKGDVFKLNTRFVLVHCIAQDARMGAGIAKVFRDKYPDMQRYIRSRKPNVGDIVVYEARDGRVIVNLVTKQSSWDKPRRSDLNKALAAFCEWVEEKEVKFIGMPKIGSGLDQLHWGTTLSDLKSLFYTVDTTIIIREL